MHTVWVAGDMSGHADVFAALVRRAGGNPATGWLPDSVVLIHTGDLVHKGPGSAACVDLAGRLMARSPGRFHSIWGNHDGHYIDGAPSVAGRRLVDPVDARTAATLRRWWGQRTLPLAVAVEDVVGDHWLVSHAGLTVGQWAALGQPDAPAAAKRSNRLVGSDAAQAFRGGQLTGGGDDPAAGTCWADTAHELLGPWLVHVERGGTVPFNQIHGHASVVSTWADRRQRLRPDLPAAVAAATVIDPSARRYEATVGGRRFVGVDWIMLTEPPATLTPLFRISATQIII